MRALENTGYFAVTQTPDNKLKLNIPSDISFDVAMSNARDPVTIRQRSMGLKTAAASA